MEPVQIVVKQPWDRQKDLAEFNSIWGKQIAAGEDPYAFTLSKIRHNLELLALTLNSAATFLSPSVLSQETLDALDIEGKIEVVRRLLVERIADIPQERQRNYLFRISEDLDRCEQVLPVQRSMVRKRLLCPGETWLTELVQTADRIGSAWIMLDESMACENTSFRSRFRRGPLTADAHSSTPPGRS